MVTPKIGSFIFFFKPTSQFVTIIVICVIKKFYILDTTIKDYNLLKSRYLIVLFLVLFSTTAVILPDDSLIAQVEGMMGSSNNLLGKTGTGHDQSRTASLSYNPAHISEITKPEINANTGLEYYMYSYRFIGDTSHSSSHIGLAGIPLPTVVYPVSKSIILGGFLIPIPVPTNIDAKKLPMGLFGQLNHVDLHGKATLNFYANIYASILRTPTMSLAANLYYASFEANVGVTANGYSGDNLVDVKLSNSTLNLKLGVKAKVLSRLYLGLSTVLYSSSTTSQQMTTVLNEDTDDDGNPDPGDEVISSSSVPIQNIRAGLTFKMLPRLMLYTDVLYQRVPKSKQFSLVDLVEKEKDTADTFSVYAGGEYIWNPKYQILAGAFYEPSSVGPGSKGKDGKAGFGFMDLAMSLGEPPTTPGWGISAGARIGFMKIKSKKRSQSSQSQAYTRYSPYYQLTLDTGVVFSMVSIGISEQGEQPATYDVTRLKFPLELTYIF